MNSPEAFPLFGVLPSRSGAAVTASSAMRVPAVRRAVSLISEAVATLPFKVYTDGKEAAKDHRAYSLTHRWANDWTSAEALREQITVDALLTGNGYAQVIRNGDGEPVELHYMAPSAVSVEHDDYNEPSYRVSLKAGGTAVLPYRDVLHVQAIGGVSPIAHAREAIGLTLAAEQHLTGFFKNGGRPSGVIEHPNKLDADAMAKLSASWFKSHGGEQSGSTAILDEGMAFKEIATKMADAEFSEVRREQVREIARAFNVAPAILFETSKATWSNFEQSQRDFLTGTLRPWVARWQAAYTRVLLTPEERGSFYIEGVVDDLLAVDHAARATAYSQYRGMGVMTANEVRAGLNLTPLDGGDDLTNPYITTNAAPAPAPAKAQPEKQPNE
ncbi:phage portal protein [Ketogulonicigenium vulgare]|uniref:phage portal protein n=1 Tax=Ketogulonicigenium vulgare TaxID=92945 RepID=UPI0023597FED|nr:phage portal protein [Ketogulonicigenium vulgare]